MTLLGADRLSEAADVALGAGADGVLVLASRTAAGLTRFASSQIHQNTWREEIRIRVTAVVDGSRIGVASGTTLDPHGVRRIATDAVSAARVTPPDPDFGGLAPPAAYASVDRHDEATAAATPGDRAVLVARALDELAPDMEGAGFVETQEDEVFLASTEGMRAYAPRTHAAFSITAMGPGTSGFAEAVERSVAALDAQALAERAARKAELGRDPRALDPGRYTVVLEPPAVVTILEFLGFLGFGAKAFLEERSFVSGRLGERLVSSLVTIADDPLAPDALGLPFDFEGTPARRHILVEEGVARDVCWDRSTARRAGRVSTGHGLPIPSPDGPLPMSIRLEPGTTSLDDLIAGTERGLLVTRFHYANVVNEKEAILTGMTRDGTFVIEDGKLRHGVRNLRFTQNAIDALRDVEAVGDTTASGTDAFIGAPRAPALRIAGFNFSSATTH